ncbi:peptidase domain-containing ABC transporter [Vampirovibrio sp.]|uniref:peptidase domain-containing ABC transporter n=1 Tax=Vampirovibrio sp. TaxID=2717857 RepID=UPI00359379E2
MASHSHHKSNITPFRRLIAFLKPDRKDLLILVLYTLLAGLLTLATPLAAQALVNTIAAGVFLQPLVVLTALLFIGMLFAGFLRVSQFFIVEVLQRRAFARVSLDMAKRVPFIQHHALATDYPPELLNRFFDIIKVQKSMAKLLLEGPAAILQILVGLVLMAIYSPLLLGFDMFVLLFLGFTAFILGRNGVNTSLNESVEKYRIAGWLEELARCHMSFKMDGVPSYIFNKTDDQVIDFIHARRSHFRILFNQAIANHFFQAVASAGILGLGGWLVIHRQLTLGQLVASELVILIMLSAIDKLITMFQDWYGLLTGVEKIAQVTDLPLERSGGKMLPQQAKEGAAVFCQDVSFSYQAGRPILRNLNLSIQPGELVSLVGASGIGKSTLANLICGLLEPKTGLVEINGVDVRDADLQSLRTAVSLVGDNHEIFDGTVEENIVVGRPIPQQDIRWALSVTQLMDEIADLPEGMKTRLISAGRNLSKGQMQRLLIARAIVSRPRLLILDEAFNGIDERTKVTILEKLLQQNMPWTVIEISHDAEVVMRSNRVLVLANGAIVESAPPYELARQEGSFFSTLFPELTIRAARR